MSPSVQRVPLGMTLMYGAGLISALLGIGSGVLKIPAMDTALRLPIKVSSATSNFMIGVTATASAAAYFARGEIVTSVAAPIALGSVVGAVLGARVLMSVPNERLRLMFIAILGILALQMLLTGLGIHLMGQGLESRGRVVRALEDLLARLLHHGTLAASGIIAFGLALRESGLVGWGVAAAGIALFILLPALRVAAMLIFFLRAGDYRYGAIAALVLLIISFSFTVGAAGGRRCKGSSSAIRGADRIARQGWWVRRWVSARGGRFHDPLLTCAQAVVSDRPKLARSPRVPSPLPRAAA